MTKINRTRLERAAVLGTAILAALTVALLAVALLLAGCNPFPAAVTQDQLPDCPCPDLALQHHPEDPDSPGECRVKSRSGVLMDAEDHPLCRVEARERGEQ